MPVERKFNLQSSMLIAVAIVFGGALLQALLFSDFEMGARAHKVFNLVEGLMWIGMGTILLWKSCSSERARNPIILAGVTFILFGLSDFVEIQTGSWFEPVWLLIWNVACVVSLVSCLVWYLALGRKQD